MVNCSTKKNECFFSLFLAILFSHCGYDPEVTNADESSTQTGWVALQELLTPVDRLRVDEGPLKQSTNTCFKVVIVTFH